MSEIDYSRITIDSISNSFSSGINMDVLRLDKIHSEISGNKIFKLKYYLEEARQHNKKTIITFGGAWSNHLLATAIACKLYEFNSIGYIRGEEPANYSYTLTAAKQAGMQLVFLSREEYRIKKREIENSRGDEYFIPEGGYGLKGAQGAGEIANHFTQQNYSHICCAAGTGTMTAGLLKSSLPQQQIISISVLKNNIQLADDIDKISFHSPSNFSIIHDYHFGGYAKYSNELIHFMNALYTATGIPSDIVYTGKLFYGVMQLAKQKFFPATSNLLLIHSGGLQGNQSLDKGTLIF